MARPKPAPLWAPADWNDDDARALKALQAGNAGEAQQQRALAWIINRACMTYDEPFHPDNPRVTDFILGRRNVGLQIVKLLNVRLGALQKIENGKRPGEQHG
jgi:hypothetical protein